MEKLYKKSEYFVIKHNIVLANKGNWQLCIKHLFLSLLFLEKIKFHEKNENHYRKLDEKIM